MDSDVGRIAASGLVATVTSALAIKALTVAGQIVASYFLTARDYGDVAVAMTAGSFAAMFSVGSWNTLLLRAPEDARVRSSVFFVGTVLSVVPVLAVLLAWNAFNAIGSSPHNALLTLIVVSPILLSPLVTIYSTELQISLNLRKLAAIQAAEGAAATVALIIAAISGLGAFALAAFRGIGAASSLLLYRVVRTRRQLVTVTTANLRATARRGALLSAYVAASSLVITLPPTIVLQESGPEVAGLLAWALQFSMQFPVMLGVSARQVQVAVAARETHGGYSSTPNTSSFPLLSAGLAVCLVQALLAPIVVPVLFAHRWDEAIPAMALLSISQCLLPLTSVQAGRALLEGRLARTLTSILVCVGMIAVASYFASIIVGGDTTSAALYVSLGYLSGNLASWFILKRPDVYLVRDEGAKVMIATCLGLVALLLTYWEHTNESVRFLGTIVLWGLGIASTTIAWRRWANLWGTTRAR